MLKVAEPVLTLFLTFLQERFRTITTAYYRGAMGIMLVYDITNEKSFENIKNWIRNIEEHASADVEKMILGNKCDMTDRRQVRKPRKPLIQGLFKAHLHCIMWQTVAFRQKDRKIPISVLTQSTVENADCCGYCESAFRLCYKFATTSNSCALQKVQLFTMHCPTVLPQQIVTSLKGLLLISCKWLPPNKISVYY